MGTESFSLHASLERESDDERWRGKKKLRDVVRVKRCVFVYVNVCVQYQLVSLLS